ncbi:E3 SUMO-protein ligase ZBED1-like [Epinephelus moara]|uniref:E3 SUMO-protein ligase ZBED1-like n=1 Tax=Epinephelus moara TaxID=300413 RepID=UPI00214E9A12|nr:E3 SUMO-protein ligase ZBED1-like [Epinephelus moara]
MAEAGEQSSENADETLVPKRESTSAIWQYFGFKREDDLQTQVLCRTCRAVVATSRGNTTNLHHHLLHHHQELHEQFKASQSKAQKSSSSKVTLPSLQQQSIAQSFVSTTPYDKSSKRHTEITEAIIHYLAMDMMPIITVTRPGFVSLVNKLDRRYEVPSRNYFSDVAIPKLYEKCRTTVESELCQVEYFACSTDLWSSRTTEPYISLTVHFVDREFQLKARCLQTQYFPEQHTGENTACGLCEALASWHLREEQLTCVTTDNRANVVKAMELNHWKMLLNMTAALPMLLDSAKNWWGSRQKMMERVLEQRRALSDVLSADRKTRHLVPSWQDLDVIESTSVLAEKEGDTDLTKDIKEKILDYMNTKYDDPATQELLDVASFMDLRFKVSYISRETVQDIKTRVMSEMKDTSQEEGEHSEAQSMDPPINKKLEQAVEAEVNSYLLSPTIDSEADPLAWWKLHHFTYPKLSKLARQYLCIPATSSPSERLFSTSGNVVTCQRACLKPTKVNMLVFLAKNLP